jgi:hypothetical protein
MLFMMVYSFMENLSILAWILLVISLVVVAFTVGLRLKREVDADDFERILWMFGPILLFSLIVAHFPSLQTIQTNFEKYEALTLKEKSVNVSEEPKPNGENENEKVPSLLRHSCSKRVCR